MMRNSHEVGCITVGSTVLDEPEITANSKFHMIAIISIKLGNKRALISPIIEQFSQLFLLRNYDAVHRIKFVLVVQISNFHGLIPLNSMTVPSGRTTRNLAPGGSIFGSSFAQETH